MREVRAVEHTRGRSHEQDDSEHAFEERVELYEHHVLPLVYETTVSLMARPVDPHRRAAVLAKAADYVLEHGLAGLSLRPLAKALRTSPRMLLYDFETKERLVHAVLAEIRRREAGLLEAEVRSLEDVWRWISAPEREPFLRVFF